MRLIKKLDIFIMKGFLQMFAGTFFICLFILLMQFMWRYMDELVGKGLSTIVLVKFMWHTSLTLIPMSLPLAILLASLITFGNFGERFELLSMKAAGIPLVRILLPILMFSAGTTVSCFLIQNYVSPEATKNLSALLNSMRMKSPELEIPEGIFYGDIPGYNIHVEKKDTEKGLLYGVMIYTNKGGYEDTEIVLADSARLQSTEDHTHLKLTLYNGERFRNMDSQSGNVLKATVPYMRESFIMEEDLISFDTNLNMMDGSLFAHDARTKGLGEMLQSLDSLIVNRDSIGHSIYDAALQYNLARNLPPNIKDSLNIVKSAAYATPLDSAFASLTNEQKSNAWRIASMKAEMASGDFSFRSIITADNNFRIRQHRMEANKKFSLSLACLFFFFIGAPLGAIIRKGGLGVPVIISVVIFIFYYMLNAYGENKAKEGVIDVIFGAWLSSAILLPTGIFLTHKANKDSVVFSTEGYIRFFMTLLGLRSKRRLNRKEIILNELDIASCKQKLENLACNCKEYDSSHDLKKFPSYKGIFFHSTEDTDAIRINDQLEALIEELHNSHDSIVIDTINLFPIIDPEAHIRPCSNATVNRWLGILLPIGIIMWFRVWRFRLRLSMDMKNIQELCPMIVTRLEHKKTLKQK